MKIIIISSLFSPFYRTNFILSLLILLFIHDFNKWINVETRSVWRNVVGVIKTYID